MIYHCRRWNHVQARPWRDRAMVFVLLSTGLRREELVRLNLSQLGPNSAAEQDECDLGLRL